jgi:hypothetical protein
LGDFVTSDNSSAAAEKKDTLASLTPELGEDLHSLFLKASSKPMGSFLNPLRRPSRLIETTRLYSPGDPIQAIDWRAFARTDQLLIRQVRDESTAKVLIGIDLSESMHWPPRDLKHRRLSSTVPQKSEIALRLGFFLSSLHLKMGDEVQIWAVLKDSDLNPSALLQPKSITELRQLFTELETEGFKGTFTSRVFHQSLLERSRHDLSYWIGDGLGRADFKLFLGFARKQLMLHLLSSLEEDISWVTSQALYYDENQVKKQYQGHTLLENQRYQRELNQWRDEMKKSLSLTNASYFSVTNDTRIDLFNKMIFDYFKSLNVSSNFGAS